MATSALEQTDCGRCGHPLHRVADGSITCACEQPMYGGMVQVGPDGFASCYACGWTGVPTYIKGRWSTHCPSCEGFGNEPDLREQALAYDIHVRRDGVYRMENGYLVPCSTPKPRAPKQSRNDPCACG